MISRKQLERWDMPLGECVTQPRHGGGYVCGFGGSGNKSSSSAATTYDTTTNNLDQRQVVDGGSFGFSNANGNVIQMMDSGAISGAATVASNALATVGIAANGSTGVANNALAAMGIISKASIDGASAGGQSLLDHATTLLTNQGTIQQQDFQSILAATLQLNQQANSTAGANLSFAKDLTTATQTAYADASQQAAGNKNLVMAGMVVIGIAAVAFLERK